MEMLLNEQPIVISKELATLIGLNESIVIQQIHYWVENNKKSKRNYYDGYYWTYNSFENWQKEFPFWSTRTIRRIFTQLENKGIVVSGNYNKKGYDRTKWYRINYDMLNSIIPCGQYVHMDKDTLSSPIPDNNANKVGYNAPEPKVSGVQQDFKTNENNDLKEFIDCYMNDLYLQKTGVKHEKIKKEQYNKVCDTLHNFLGYYGLEIEDLYQIAVNYLNKVDNVDYNINHFATEGVLCTRALNAGYSIAYD